MSGQAWRSVLTYNRYTQVAARAVRRCMAEEARVAAERRGLTALRYQTWENGQGGVQTALHQEEQKPAGKSAAV